MKEYKIASIAGDGIGKEVVPEGLKILKEIAKQHQFKLVVEEYDFASCFFNFSCQSSGNIFPYFS